MKDTTIYEIAIKLAHKEFKTHKNCYRCEIEDLALELYSYYCVHIKHQLKEYTIKAQEAEMTLEQYLMNALYFEMRHIRRREKTYSHRFLIETEIFDGTIEGNHYFELLEQTGKLHLWNDNEKIIDTKEKHQSYNRMCNWEKSSELSSIEEDEIWSLLQKNLSKRDFEIVQMIMLEEKTEREVARRFGISHQAVHKIVNKLRKLKELFKEYK